MPDRREAGRAPSLMELLRSEPERFEFDAAMLILLAAGKHASPADVVLFRAVMGLSYPRAALSDLRVQDERLTATPAVIGLTGPLGVLPRHYSEIINAERRRGSEAFATFLDLLAQRVIGGYVEAGIRYRPHRAAQLAAPEPAGPAAGTGHDRIREFLLALTGHAVADSGRQSAMAGPQLYYAGHFASWPRSVERLRAILVDWLGLPVTIEQFHGAWLAIDESQQSSLGLGENRFNQLGYDVAIGARVWDAQSQISLRIGPLPLARFTALLPNGSLLPRLVSLVRSFVGPTLTFAINPVLRAADVPSLELRAGVDTRLGWMSWLGRSGPRSGDADEATFEPASGSG